MEYLPTILRIGKLLGVLLFFSGTLGALASKSHEDRELYAYRFCGPGFLMLWGFGVGLTHVGGVPLFSWWIMGSGLCSLISINAALYVAGKADRGGPVASVVGLAPLLIALVLMVTRPG